MEFFSYWKLNSPQNSKCGKCCPYVQTRFAAGGRKAQHIGCDEHGEIRRCSNAVGFLQIKCNTIITIQLHIQTGYRWNLSCPQWTKETRWILLTKSTVNTHSGFPRVSKDLKSFVVDDKQVKQLFIKNQIFFTFLRLHIENWTCPSLLLVNENLPLLIPCNLLCLLLSNCILPTWAHYVNFFFLM